MFPNEVSKRNIGNFVAANFIAAGNLRRFASNYMRHMSYLILFIGPLPQE